MYMEGLGKQWWDEFNTSMILSWRMCSSQRKVFQWDSEEGRKEALNNP